MKKYLAAFLTALTLGSSLAHAHDDNTVRHVYNNSDAIWLIHFEGNDFSVGSAEKNHSGYWIVAPKSTYNLNYGKKPKGSLQLCDSKVPSHCYVFSLDGKTYINHNGNTSSSFDLNRPAKGDIRIFKSH